MGGGKSVSLTLLSPDEIIAMKFPEVIRHHGHYIELLHSNGYGYPIEHERMNSGPKVLGWIHHLCGKNWITREHLRAFVLASESLGVKVNMNS